MRTPRDRLAPRLVDRLGAAVRPGWARSMYIRRGAAALLVLTAIAIVALGRGEDDRVSVMVAAHDLLPGVTVTAGDVTTRKVPGSLVPDGAIRMSVDAAGRTVTGLVRSGEIMTDARLLSPRLPASLTGRADARLVPVRLADEAVSSLLRSGDVVDVLGPGAEVLARRAVVALDADPPSTGLAGKNPSDTPILLAMGEDAAHRVAAAGLDVALAVVVH